MGNEKADSLLRSPVIMCIRPVNQTYLPERFQGCYFKTYVEKYSHCSVNYNSKLNKCTYSSVAVAITLHQCNSCLQPMIGFFNVITQ